MTTPRTRTRRGRPAATRVSAALVALSSRDCTVLGLMLVERLSLVEAAVALEITVPQLRREYEAAVARVHRALAPFVRTARPTASRAMAAWRRAS
jgi:hypothetical protein